MQLNQLCELFLFPYISTLIFMQELNTIFINGYKLHLISNVYIQLLIHSYYPVFFLYQYSIILTIKIV